MGYYSTAQVCLAGHHSTSDITNTKRMENFCSQCGQKTITQCPSCNADIRGYYHTPGCFSLRKYVAPAFCYNCGKPFPWTQSRLDFAKELIAEMDELTSDEQEKFNNSLPNILSETPQTPLAATRINKYLAKIAPVSKEGIKQLFFDITIEAAKKIIWS